MVERGFSAQEKPRSTIARQAAERCTVPRHAAPRFRASPLSH